MTHLSKWQLPLSLSLSGQSQRDFLRYRCVSFEGFPALPIVPDKLPPSSLPFPQSGGVVDSTCTPVSTANIKHAGQQQYPLEVMASCR
jgi:hypothetical protein